MGAQNALGHALMWRDVITGRQDRKPRNFNIGHLLQKRCGKRRLCAILLQGRAKAKKEKRAPVCARGNRSLVWRDILESWNLFAILQDDLHFISDLFPIVRKNLKERKIPILHKWLIFDKALLAEKSRHHTCKLLARNVNSMPPPTAVTLHEGHIVLLYAHRASI